MPRLLERPEMTGPGIRENQTCTALRSTISRHILPPISRWGNQWIHTGDPVDISSETTIKVKFSFSRGGGAGGGQRGKTLFFRGKRHDNKILKLRFCRFQRQRCIKIRVLRAQDFYTPLALKTAKGQHLPALVVYKNPSPKFPGGGISGFIQEIL